MDENKQLPKPLKLESGTEITCPACGTRTTIVQSYGLYYIGFHKKKFFLSETLYVEADCCYVSGLEIQETKVDNKAI